MLGIEWRHDGRRLVIPVSILAPAPGSDLTSVNGSALVDTGSTISGITKNVATQLGLVARGKRPLSSAQGEGQSERYLFRLGLVPDRRENEPPAFPYIFEEVIGFELTNAFQFEALIGMDILRQCHFNMDVAGLCRLAFGRP
jgi:hypothetical protein